MHAADAEHEGGGAEGTTNRAIRANHVRKGLNRRKQRKRRGLVAAQQLSLLSLLPSVITT